jgi:hypothetical protein
MIAQGQPVTRYLLDTNIISNLTKPSPSPKLLAWLAGQPDDRLLISSLSLAEIQLGILSSPSGKKRQELQGWFEGPRGPVAYFASRILPFDDRAALAWAALMAEGRNAGRPRSEFDTMIGAIARVNDCVVATDNEKDLPGIAIFNPIRDGS